MNCLKHKSLKLFVLFSFCSVGVCFAPTSTSKSTRKPTPIGAKRKNIPLSQSQIGRDKLGDFQNMNQGTNGAFINPYPWLDYFAHEWNLNPEEVIARLADYSSNYDQNSQKMTTFFDQENAARANIEAELSSLQATSILQTNESRRRRELNLREKEKFKEILQRTIDSLVQKRDDLRSHLFERQETISQEFWTQTILSMENELRIMSSTNPNYWLKDRERFNREANLRFSSDQLRIKALGRLNRQIEAQISALTQRIIELSCFMYMQS